MSTPSTKTSLLIDAFLGYDEIELAKFRISYLSSVVDFVVIGESEITFRGGYKPLFFQEWLRNSPELSSRVIVAKLNLLGTDPWSMESSARESLLEFLIHRFPHSGYIISDLDEIPSVQQATVMRELQGDFHFKTPTFYRRANWSTSGWNSNWNKAVFTTRQDSHWPNAGRHIKLPEVQSRELGCHFSYLGFDASKMQVKLKSFSHMELDLKEISNQEFLDYCDRFLIDHLGRIDSESYGLLNQMRFDELSPMGKSLYSWNQDFFQFAACGETWIKRIMASALVSMVTNNDKFGKYAFMVIVNERIQVWRRIFVSGYAIGIILKSMLKKRLRFLFRGVRLRKW